MNTLAQVILADTEKLPEGAPIRAKELLHLGSRAAVDQALSRLARRGRLLRFSRGVYVRPVEYRFGIRPPCILQALEALADLKGETVTPFGAAAANKLGLSTQVPVRLVYLTSGPSRHLFLEGQTVELRHALPWQLALAGRPAGDAIRALDYLGPEWAGRVSWKLKGKLSGPDLQELASVRPILPAWLAEQVSEIAVDG